MEKLSVSFRGDYEQRSVTYPPPHPPWSSRLLQGQVPEEGGRSPQQSRGLAAPAARLAPPPGGGGGEGWGPVGGGDPAELTVRSFPK